MRAVPAGAAGAEKGWVGAWVDWAWRAGPVAEEASVAVRAAMEVRVAERWEEPGAGRRRSSSRHKRSGRLS